MRSEVPPKLYKYTSLEYINSCIENGIYASRLENINDPFEVKDIRYKEQFRVVCLTTSYKQMLMWAYYGNHRGCCIEYDVSNLKGIRPINYIKTFQSHNEMSNEELIESLYNKGFEWKHENEYRLVYCNHFISENQCNIVNNDVFFKLM